MIDHGSLAELRGVYRLRRRRCGSASSRTTMCEFFSGTCCRFYILNRVAGQRPQFWRSHLRLQLLSTHISFPPLRSFYVPRPCTWLPQPCMYDCTRASSHLRTRPSSAPPPLPPRPSPSLWSNYRVSMSVRLRVWQDLRPALGHGACRIAVVCTRSSCSMQPMFCSACMPHRCSCLWLWRGARAGRKACCSSGQFACTIVGNMPRLKLCVSQHQRRIEAMCATTSEEDRGMHAGANWYFLYMGNCLRVWVCMLCTEAAVYVIYRNYKSRGPHGLQGIRVETCLLK